MSTTIKITSSGYSANKSPLEVIYVSLDMIDIDKSTEAVKDVEAFIEIMKKKYFTKEEPAKTSL